MDLFHLEMKGEKKKKSHIFTVSCKNTSPFLPPMISESAWGRCEMLSHGVTSWLWVHLQLGVMVQSPAGGGEMWVQVPSGQS